MLQRIVFVLVGLVLAGAIGVAVFDSTRAPPPERGGRTADRLSQRAMARMVETPMERVAAGRMDQARKAFEADLAKAEAKGGLRPGDMLTAFAMRLAYAEREREAVPYFERAVAAYRKAAPGSPELAVALLNYAWGLSKASDVAPAAADSALAEALRIREARLGRGNAETAEAYVRLGELKGRPSRTSGDPARIEAAAELVRTGLRLYPGAVNVGPNDLDTARYALAEIYARNGRTEETFRAAADYVAGAPQYRRSTLRGLADALEEAGDAAAAAQLRAEYGVSEQAVRPHE